MLVAEIDGAVVGLASVAVVPLLAEGATMLRITALSVAPAARRRGVGRALVDDVLNRACDRGADIVEVCSGRRPERAEAHRLYAAAGFDDASDTSVRFWRWLDAAGKQADD